MAQNHVKLHENGGCSEYEITLMKLDIEDIQFELEE